MTRKTKCDVCRTRKVKCDESRPQCLRCAKRGLACSYAYGKVSDYLFIDEKTNTKQRHRDPCIPRFELRTVTTNPPRTDTKTFLSERSSRGAKSGSGVFQTFPSVVLDKNIATDFVRSRNQPGLSNGRCKSPIDQSLEILYYPECTQTKIAAQFVSLLGPEPPSSNPHILWGTWINLIPARLGLNNALDKAAVCYVAGVVAYLTRTEASVCNAQARYVEALKSLQATVDNSELNLGSETLSAVKMLSIFETLMGMYTNAWVTHARGLFKLMLARGANECDDELGRGVYYSSYWQEVSEAILGDKVSDFDSPEWFDFPPPELTSDRHNINSAPTVVMQNLVRIPRLMKLVRSLRRDPSNMEIAAEANHLAEAVYANDLEFWVSQTVASNIVPTTSPDLSVLVPESLLFNSYQEFEILNRYWTTQIFLFGLVQSLATLTPLPTTLDLETIVEEEIQAATYIAMSSDYAVDPLPQPRTPLGAKIIILPLQISFGAWYRMEKREELLADVGNRGGAMKKWALERSNQMLSLWRGKELGEAELERKSDAFAGDEMLPWMGRTIKH